MVSEYTKEQINQLLKNDMFYRKDCLNYIGYCSDDKNLSYQEYISDILLKELKNKKSDFEKRLLGVYVPTDFNYKGEFPDLRKNHKFEYRSKNDGKDNKRHEDNIAKRIVQECIEEKKVFNNNIKIIEFQVPTNRQDGSLHGKVDMVGIDKNKNELLLIELKDTNSEETLLRAIIEIYTYYLKILKAESLNSSKNSPDFYYYMKKENCIKIVPCVMFFRGFKNRPCADFDDMKKKKNNLYELSKKLGIHFFSVTDNTNNDNMQLTPIYNKTEYIINEENY